MEQTAAGSASALRRKMAAALEQVPGQGGGLGRPALGALRLGLARGASEELDLALAVIGVRQTRCGADDLAPLLRNDRMLVVLDGPDGAAGAAAFDRALVSGLIQHQTMGAITNGTPDDRPFTGTDAAMASPLLNGMFERAPDLADLDADRRCLAGFRFGAQAEDAQALLLILASDKYRVFTLTIEFASGVLQGELMLVLPEPSREPVEVGDPDGDIEPVPGEERFGGLRAELNAVICQMRLPLSQLSALQTGDMIPLAMPDGLAKTRLRAITGETLSFGRLGRINGMRAVRVNESRAPMATAHSDGQFQPEPDETATLVARPRGSDDPMGKLDGDLPELPDLPDLPDQLAPLPAVMSGMGGQKDGPATLSPEQTRAEISELAGLTGDLDDPV